ncbi:MAG: sigma-70 family RNA polymerase sigma factor [Planctomycetota bacterium]|nr:sigma-70 family RNA polymerase sigma factor [Planctomycetota bacterium]
MGHEHPRHEEAVGSALPSGGDGPDADLARVLREAAGGSQQAWGVLVGMYGRRIFALAKSRCRKREVAEDITQSVLATVATKLSSGEYVEQGRFEAWLFRVVMNRVRDHVRSVRRRPEMAAGEAVEGVAASGHAATGGSELDALRSAMDRLADADREVIELRHHGGMSFKEMAEMLGEPLGTLLARHHRALRKLREMMEAAEVRGEVTT